MHKVLEIPELLDMVLAYLPRKSLASVAQTSRNLHGAAVVGLWRQANRKSIGSLAEIILKPFGADGGALQSSLSARWERFSLYASLIEELEMRFHGVFETDTPWREDMRTIASLRPSVPLLPRLRVISARCENPEDLDSVIQFIGPTLRRLSVFCAMEAEGLDDVDVVAAWGVRFCSLLFKVTQEAPGLKEVSLHGWTHLGTVFADALQALIARLPNLQLFESNITALSRPVFSALADSTSLTQLQIGNGDDDIEVTFDGPAIARSIKPGAFASLRALSVDGNVSTATALVRSISTELVEMAFVIHSVILSPEGLVGFATAVFGGSKRLDRLHLEFVEEEFEAPFLWENLRGLLQCRAISDFSFTFFSHNQLDLRDDHLASMAEAWPFLQSLVLQWKPLRVLDSAEGAVNSGGLEMEEGLTLAGLAALASHCPKLKSLSMTSLDARGSLPPPPAIRSPAQSIRLILAEGYITKQEQVALYLATIWPKVVISVRCEADNKGAKAWGAVSAMIRVAQCHSALQRTPGLLDEARFLSTQGVMEGIFSALTHDV